MPHHDRTMCYAILAKPDFMENHLVSSEAVQKCSGHERQRRTEGPDPGWGSLRGMETPVILDWTSGFKKGHGLQPLVRQEYIL